MLADQLLYLINFSILIWLNVFQIKIITFHENSCRAVDVDCYKFMSYEIRKLS